LVAVEAEPLVAVCRSVHSEPGLDHIGVVAAFLEREVCLGGVGQFGISIPRLNFRRFGSVFRFPGGASLRGKGNDGD
jgi:hypothetical protein